MNSKAKEVFSIITIIFLVTMILQLKYGIFGMDFNYPIKYGGADDMFILVDGKLHLEEGWMLKSDRLGAPYGTQFTDFLATLLSNAGQVILWFWVHITGSWVVGVNLLYFSIFYLCGLISYFVCRQLKINTWVSVLISTAYAASPFIMMRGQEHIVLAECFFVPLSVLVCFWMYEDEEFFKLSKSFFKYKKNYVGILFALLIANNGIAYYPFFTCLMVGTVGLSKFLKTKKIRYIGRALTYCMCIAAFLVLAMVPQVYIAFKYGAANSADRTGFTSVELYALKIVQLFLPVNGHGISFLENGIATYNNETIALNENITSYITIAGIIGFMCLMFVLLMKKNTKLMERLQILSEINLVMVLFGTLGGFGAVFALLVTKQMRCLNRISIFIEYLCFIALALIANVLFEKYKANKNKVLRWAVPVGFTIIMLFSIAEGIPGGRGTDPSVKERFDSDKMFIEMLEDTLPEGASIYQLPYMPYPETPYVNEMATYQHYIGFLHSDKLKWSYGSVKTRPEDEWNKQAGQMDAQTLVNYLKDFDFAGVYVDKRAYTDEEYKLLEEGLAAATGNKPETSNNGLLVFFRIDY